MAEVRPLRGVRFDSHRSGPVGSLIAPPYDVAAEPGGSPEYSIRHIEGVDLGGHEDDHRLAAARYGDWLARGVLARDADPAVYLHTHHFLRGDAPIVRTGILARVRLRDWEDRIVLPHERTNPGPREERLNRLRAVGANLSPLYFLYRDPDSAIRNLIPRYTGEKQTPDHRDPLGGLHGLQAMADPAFHAELAQVFAERTLFVADGHHRYEAALAYRDECRASGETAADAPFEYVLALLAAAEDPGVVVLPTHRLLVGAEGLSPDLMLIVGRQMFDVRAAAQLMPRASDDFAGRLVLPGRHGAWDLFTLPGRPHLDLMPPGRGPAWRSLAVSAVEGLAAALLGARAAPDGSFLIPNVDTGEAVRRVERGEAQAAFLLPDPSLDRLLAVAEEGDLLPPKSTWFEPKAPAGLIINDLRP